MLVNLSKELKEADITFENIAQDCGVSNAAVQHRIKVTGAFSVKEGLLIQKKYFPDKSLEYLFEEQEGGRAK